MKPGRPRAAMWQVLVSSLGRRRRDLAALAVWAAIEALPAYLSGRLVALATDRGFLAGRPGTGFAWLGAMARRQRASILAGEGIATEASVLSGGFRDIVAGGGESPAAAIVEREVDAQADATRELARFTAVRTLGLAVGGLLPVVLILMAGPRLVRHGA